MNDPNLTDQDLILIGTRYHIQVDPDNATHYKLCRVIHTLEQEVIAKGGTIPDFGQSE